jgi:hypothetical protein
MVYMFLGTKVGKNNKKYKGLEKYFELKCFLLCLLTKRLYLCLPKFSEE